MDSIVLKAREFARHAHKSQARRYVGGPYFLHLEEVAGLVANARLPDTAIAAAWLHDVVEDQGVPPLRIFTEFGEAVGVLVAALTDEPPSAGTNRKERNEKNIIRLLNSGSDAHSIKCADLISNTSTIIKFDPGFAKIYLPEKRAVLDVLTRAHGGLKAMAEESLRNAERQLLDAALAPKPEGVST